MVIVDLGMECGLHTEVDSFSYPKSDVNYLKNRRMVAQVDFFSISSVGNSDKCLLALSFNECDQALPLRESLVKLFIRKLFP